MNAILDLFPRYPQEMTVLYLRYYEDQLIDSLERLMDRSDRTVERTLRNALGVLKGQLEGLQ
jgi:hypothetical protein